ncbi:glycoside hydrolase family 97 protein [Flammeovirgaceae bacterium SG7u.111]|nr:glycoside hydrolase family 97 protein [Flammeovirgaceae bacterium SG7u.132]WPO33724.1 glycoside hydrolase family 97 protein [Flammeovirgaceae bacterium SG7u.111]
MHKNILTILLLLSPVIGIAQTYEVTSKDNNTTLTVKVGEDISWSVIKGGKTVIENVAIGLNLGNMVLGEKAKVSSHKIVEVAEDITAVVPQKNKVIPNSYKELQLNLKGRYAVHFRVYNEGVAYRFASSLKGEIEVHSEKMEVTFPASTTSFFPKEDKMYSHYEREYLLKKLDTIPSGEFCSLPVMFTETNGFRLLFSEADLYDYPNLFLAAESGNTLKAVFPNYVLETRPDPARADRNEIITKKADYIAKTQGARSFPWRLFVISDDDKTFLENDMVYKLSRPLEIEDVSWIKPGKVAWDWYNDNNIYGVDFKAGLNTETYKYYIDFASTYGLEYVILDEGWTKSTTDILEGNPELDVKELIAYGKEKDVGIILWCLWKPLNDNMEEILQTYADWGAKGVKVDFMQRADQYMVTSFTKIAQEAAKRKLLVDYHGAYKPSGLRRAYPNVISYEGVKGNENNKWSKEITPTHNVTLPFIRMAVGPMDFTPGAMSNSQLINHKISHYRPQSLGTRAHQVAMYIVFESALQMLCDAPSTYLKDKATVEFIAPIPSVWDETHALEANIGEYVAVARKSGDNWYVGAMTNWDEREMTIDFSFLPEGNYEVTMFKDGVNASRYAEDYKVEKVNVDKSSKITIQLAKGGGWAATLKKL